MSVAVVTIVHGRSRHLREQQRGLARSAVGPDHYVVVAMDDPDALPATRTGPLAGTGTELHLVDLPAGAELPLAAARNSGAAAALAAGADQLVFLDVDCIPSRNALGAYLDSLRAAAEPALHCGAVRYLDEAHSRTDPPVLEGLPHPARPALPPGETAPSTAWPLFWSLSFAVDAPTWRMLGGFCADYTGYGAEDTDFALAAHEAGVNLRWVGGADVFHQHHPSSSPPVGHRDAILRNAAIFHRRWGRWPMEGWLRQFAELGIATFRDGSWEPVDPVDHGRSRPATGAVPG
ncbi:MAG: glycosyltransferase family 2 protein [Nakamurella sp.]